MPTEDEMEVALEELRKRIQNITPLPEEPLFLKSDETLLRYLKAHEWDVTEAEKRLSETVEYRRSSRPLHASCPWCLRRPGFHSMRQVGFDELGRPVLYSCFAQAATHKNKVEDAVAHVTYLIENAKVTMKPGISTWVFVIDCTGLSIPACNPKLGYGVTQIMGAHYPERLGLVVCLNHNPVFQGIWKAIKVFLHPNTISKMKLVRSKDKIQQTFQKNFPEELTQWLLEEINLNKSHPLSENQRNFWSAPDDPSAHDPRGCTSYIRQYIDTYKNEPETSVCGHHKVPHKPHPNIIDSLKGIVRELPASQEEQCEREAARAIVGVSSARQIVDNDLEETENDFQEIDIDESFKIPRGAAALNT